MPGIDLHTHLAPALSEREPSGPDGVGSDAGFLSTDGRRVGPAALHRPTELISYLDAAGLDAAAVAVPPPFFRQAAAPGGPAAWAHALNDGLLRAVGGRSRLLPLAYLPLEDPEAAVAEYRRVRRDDRWAGVTAAAGGLSRSLADPAFVPLWRELDADGRLLLLHPAATADARLDPFYLSNLLGNPVETAVATAELVFAGVLAAHPGLRVLLVHCGGSVPAVVGRWQRGYVTSRPGVDRAVEEPVAAVRRLYADCLAHDPAVVDLAVTTFGAERLVLGSDWPFPMGTPDPASLVAHRGTEFVRKIAMDNACAALGEFSLSGHGAASSGLKEESRSLETQRDT